MVKGHFIQPSIKLRRGTVYRGWPISRVRFRLTRRFPAGVSEASGSLSAAVARRWALALCVVLCAQVACGITLRDLKADKQLTPERLIKYVADFKFEPGEIKRRRRDL